MMMVSMATKATAAGHEIVLQTNGSEYNYQDETYAPLEGTCGDRIWLVSTRHLSNEVCRANLVNPNLAVSELDACGRRLQSSLAEYQFAKTQGRQTVIYVHGNRTPASVAIERGLTIYRFIARYRCGEPIDWVIWSWPSEQHGILIHDAREKAKRTDAHGMYLAMFVRDNFDVDDAPTMIGYSFGGRVVTGSLHALAGGKLGGRTLPGAKVLGTPIRAGLVAPAIEQSWLQPCGYHGKATQNLEKLVLMYNHRDSVLKRYWLLDRVRSSVALGYSGPRVFGPRYDGSRLPVIARDFAQVIGHNHDELDYYQKDCRASSEMARLIHGTRPHSSNIEPAIAH